MTDKKDPKTGLSLRKDGNYIESSGTGPNKKLKIIPPSDMAELVEKGIAPSLIPNWDRDDPESNWFCSYRKFTPERKQKFLTILQLTGRVGLAANHAGVNSDTIRKHRKSDPDFDTACLDAIELYHETTVAAITYQARAGMIDRRWDGNGNLLSERVSYEQQIRRDLLRRGDPSYQETSRQEVAVIGGAVVVPAPIDSVESWEDVVRKHTGASVAGSAAADPHSEESGGNAMVEGRVVKRTILEAEGSEVKENERKEE